MNADTLRKNGGNKEKFIRDDLIAKINWRLSTGYARTSERRCNYSCLLFAADDAVSIPMLPLVRCQQFDSDASSSLLLLAADDAVSVRNDFSISMLVE